MFVRGPGLGRRAFTLWGRVGVAVHAARVGAGVVHGLHVETPPGHVPSVVTIHDVVPLDHPASMPSSVRRNVYRRVLATSLRRATRVIVPSPATAGRLAALGADPSKVDVIPLGVGPAFRPSSPAERDDARRRFAGGRRYVVASTGARAHKNLAGMQQAAAILSSAGIVAAATGGSQVDGIRSVGWLDDEDLRHFYGGAEAMVLPALIEGFGLPAVEALACGVPVVCGPGTGALPYIRPGALEVDVTRPGELAAGILDVVEDDSRRARLVIDGARAASSLTAAGMAAATLAVYERVLAETSR